MPLRAWAVARVGADWNDVGRGGGNFASGGVTGTGA